MYNDRQYFQKDIKMWKGQEILTCPEAIRKSSMRPQIWSLALTYKARPDDTCLSSENQRGEDRLTGAHWITSSA